MADERNHKWLRSDSREVLEAFGLQLEARAFLATKRRTRVSFANTLHPLPVLLGLAPWPTDLEDVALVMHALDVLEQEAPRIASALRAYANERAAIAGTPMPRKEGHALG